MTNSAEDRPNVAEQPYGRRKLALYQQTLIGLVLGVITGVFLGELAAVFKIIGDIFIRLLQVTVIPYISLSLITGLGSLGFDTVKRLAFRGGGVLLVLWLIAVVLVLLFPLAFPDWPSASFFSTSLVEETIPPDFLLLFIPSNPFFSYANALVPAVVVFSVLVGIALIGIKEKHAIIEPLTALLHALAKVTGLITKLAPLGVFALMANTVGTIAIADLVRLQIFIVLYASFALVFSLWVLPGLIATLTPLRFADVSRGLRTPLVTAFATGSGLIVVPMLIEKCKQLIADEKIVERDRREYADSLVDVLIPTVYPFPSSGVVLVLSFVLFAGWYIGSGISPAAYSALIAAGIPSLFAGTLTSMPFLLDLVQLPSDLFYVFVSIDVITARFATLVGAMHYASIGLIGSMAMLGKLHFHWPSLLRYIVISTLLIAAVITGVHAFYSHVVVAPYTKDEALKSLRLHGTPQPSTVYPEVPADRIGTGQKPAGVHEIAQRGVLRVCYQPNEYPSAFYNNASPPQLVGFDIEMAHRLARRQQLALEFFPTPGENQAAVRLNTGVCDIYMRSLAVSAGRTQMFGLTVPVYTSSVGLIVRDHRRDEFREWKTLRARGDALRIGLEASEESISLMRDILPDAILAPMDLVEQEQVLATGTKEIDAIADMAEEGAAWTVLYPSFNVVVPQPAVSIPVAYAVARGNSDLLEAFNAWLVAEEARGTMDLLYHYWMLGDAIKAERPARWSVIRDVLGWVD
ncbi:MAG: cation:dicarboxylase symporter family transporter [Thiotrichales bacterium]|nr:MAG: cation:dicarboxylase symporter family transporter [Thiotrichales bacterium]